MTKEEIAALVAEGVAKAMADQQRADLVKSQQQQSEQRIKELEEGLSALNKSFEEGAPIPKSIADLSAKVDELIKAKSPKGGDEGAGGGDAKPGIFD